jgi:hypothetical protein
MFCSRHITRVFEEGELSRGATVAESATVQREGDRGVTRDVEYFNLDVIIDVATDLCISPRAADSRM